MGRKALDAMMDVLAGKTVEKKIDIPTFLVTSENLASVQQTLVENVFPAMGK